MKIPNYLTISFTFLGIISFIMIACSADNNNAVNNVNTIGKYQISTSPNSNYGKFHVMDTETGIVKTFEKQSSNGDYVLISTTITQ